MGLAQPTCLGPGAGAHLASPGWLLPPTSGTGDSEQRAGYHSGARWDPRPTGTPVAQLLLASPPLGSTGTQSHGSSSQGLLLFLHKSLLPLDPGARSRPLPPGITRQRGGIPSLLHPAWGETERRPSLIPQMTPTCTAPMPPPQQAGQRPPRSQNHPDPSEFRGGSFRSGSAQAPVSRLPGRLCHHQGTECALCLWGLVQMRR